MRRKRFLILILVVSVWMGGMVALLAHFRRCITPRVTLLPKRDIVFQEYIQFAQVEPSGKIGFVNADGSGKTSLIVAHIECNQEKNFYARKQLRMPFVEEDKMGFLIHPQPYTIYGGRLQIYNFVKGVRLPCKLNLRSRPSPVGQQGAYVGMYQWAEDGGAVLFWPTEKACKTRDLWSAEQLQEMGVFQVIGFHHRGALLLLGGQVPRQYDLVSGQLTPLPWLPASCWGMISRDDRWLACGGYVKDEQGAGRQYSIRVVSLKGGELWRERRISGELIPSFGMGEVSWSPDGKALVYHRCRKPNPEKPKFCEALGAENVGIYIWDLEAGKERLVTTGGVLPYWIDWSGVPSEALTP